MGKTYVKQRILEPTSKSLGMFDAKDLEEVETEWEESDDPGEEGGQQGNKQSHQPNDDKTNTQQEKQNELPTDWDPQGNSLDEEDPDDTESEEEDDGNSGGGGDTANSVEDGLDTDDNGEDSEDNEDASDNSSNGNSESGDESDGSDGSDGEESDGENSDGSSGQSSDGSESDGEDDESSDGESSDGSSSDGEDGESSDGESSDGSDSDSNSNSNGSDSDSQQSGKGGSGSSDDNEEDSEDEFGDEPGEPTDDEEDFSDDESDDESDDTDGVEDYSENQSKGSDGGGKPSSGSDRNDNDINSMSDLEKALKEAEDSKTDSEKFSEDPEEDEDDINLNDNAQNMKQDAPTDEEKRAAREALYKALEDAKKNNELTDDEQKILKGMGGDKLTNSMFNNSTANDWRTKLDRLFDEATGFDIISNPNLVNKKIEDAPPGREDEIPMIRNVLILMDWSGSMDALKYKACISHIDTMLGSRNMNNTTFHIIPWGTTSVNEIMPYYTKCKGRNLKTTFMSKFSASGPWGTHIAAGLEVASVKVRHPDAIIVLTDMELGGDGDFFRSDIAQRYMRVNKKKFIWAFTPDTSASSLNKYLKSVAPYSYQKRNFVKFKKGGSEND